MKVCVFGAASNSISARYLDSGYELGKALAEAGFDLVFGGGQNGMMGAVARGMKVSGAHIISVVPEFFRHDTIEELYKDYDKIYYTTDMATRQWKMEELAAAFIIAPGGIGTYEEFFEVLDNKQLEILRKPIAVYNVDGYYDELEALLHKGGEQFFMRVYKRQLYRMFNYGEYDQMFEYLKTIEEDDNIPVSGYKYGNP